VLYDSRDFWGGIIFARIITYTLQYSMYNNIIYVCLLHTTEAISPRAIISLRGLTAADADVAWRDDSADIARDSVPENRRTQFKIMASNKRTCASEYVCECLYANFLMGPRDGLR